MGLGNTIDCWPTIHFSIDSLLSRGRLSTTARNMNHFLPHPSASICKTLKKAIHFFLIPVTLFACPTFAQQEKASLKDEATGMTLSARLRESSLIELDENNKPLPPDLELVITARGKFAADAIEMGFLKLHEIIADDDSRLQPREPRNEFFDRSKRFEKITGRGKGFFAKHPIDGMKIPFGIVRPPDGVSTIKLVKGSFRVRSGGERSVIRKDRALANLGLIESAELKAYGVQARIFRHDTETLKVELTGKGRNAAYQVSVLNETGKKLAALNGSSWTEEKESRVHSFSFSRAVPANVVVHIFLARNTTEKEIPFVFSNLPIPQVAQDPGDRKTPAK